MCFIIRPRPPWPIAYAAPATSTATSAPAPISIFLFIVSSLLIEYAGRIATRLRGCFALLLQVSLRLQRPFDAGAGIARLQRRRLARQRLHQLDVLAGELRADLVGDLRQRALALVAALADQPLAEELLVQHLLVLVPSEALLAALGDPVAARVRRVDLVDHPELAAGVDAELVLGVDQDQPPLLCPRLAGSEETERHPGHLVPQLLRHGAARDQLPGRNRFVVLADLFL